MSVDATRRPSGSWQDVSHTARRPDFIDMNEPIGVRPSASIACFRAMLPHRGFGGSKGRLTCAHSPIPSAGWTFLLAHVAAGRDGSPCPARWRRWVHATCDSRDSGDSCQVRASRSGTQDGFRASIGAGTVLLKHRRTASQHQVRPRFDIMPHARWSGCLVAFPYGDGVFPPFLRTLWMLHASA